jgi:hypothetical protein
MKSALALLFVSVLAFDTFAAEAEDQALAREYLELRGFEKSYQAYLARFSMYCADAPEAAQSECYKAIQGRIGWDAIKGDVLDLVSTTYTRDELQAAIAFLKSPAGSSYSAKNEKFAAKLQQMSMTKLQGALQDAGEQAPAAAGEAAPGDKR